LTEEEGLRCTDNEDEEDGEGRFLYFGPYIEFTIANQI
jgi:hypothetical protein